MRVNFLYARPVLVHTFKLAVLSAHYCFKWVCDNFSCSTLILLLNYTTKYLFHSQYVSHNKSCIPAAVVNAIYINYKNIQINILKFTYLKQYIIKYYEFRPIYWNKLLIDGIHVFWIGIRNLLLWRWIMDSNVDEFRMNILFINYLR